MDLIPWSRVVLFRLSILFASCATSAFAVADEPQAGAAKKQSGTLQSLAGDLQPLWEALSGRANAFDVNFEVELPIDGKAQQVQGFLRRYDDQAFDLTLAHPDYEVQLRRREGATAFALPKHAVVFVGTGEVDPDDMLAPKQTMDRLISPDTTLAPIVQTITSGDPLTALRLASAFVRVEFQADQGRWQIDGKTFVSTERSPTGTSVFVAADDFNAKLSYSSVVTDSPKDCTDWPGFKQQTLQRVELEKTLARGVRRALEILQPGPNLVSPAQAPRKVPNGELRYYQDQRLVLLAGTPEEVGTAHGQLLPQESERCIDSVLYAFGTAQTIRTGRWFRQDLEDAYARLRPHIPADHIAETRALAVALGEDPRLLEVLNVFPELFHCSGFAVFGSATLDGKLYHGRVLDYMTTIGLQDCATTFVVAIDDKITFANIGYAGFTGSVSGMNSRGISLGEMGGRGEGAWDGAPMATLMRRAMEECDTLEEVQTLWKNSPRTCEYFYVFADGNQNSAVGVAATPESIEFIGPGEGHERLGDGIEDCVVLSAGSRLETLRKRVQESHGKIDIEKAIWLMSRPVAMESNLHNVLFVPEDGVFYVANADHQRPAAECRYVRYDLHALLSQVPVAKRQPAEPLEVIGQTYDTKDSLAPIVDPNADAQECVAGLSWEVGDFTVHCDPAKNWKYDTLVRFPSPRPSGDEAVDQVAMEWSWARNEQGEFIDAPALIVVHESGRDMTVGRLLAFLLSRSGLHTFMVQMPGYDLRRGTAVDAPSRMVDLWRQGIADARRARDAAAVLPRVNAQHIGIQGTSLGGFISTLAASIDNRYDSVFLLLSGGDIHGVLQNGDRDAAKTRQRLAAAGLEGETLKQALRTIEPNRIAHRIAPERAWLFTANRDTVVPAENSLSLVRVMQLDPSHHITFAADHYSGIVHLPQVISRITAEIRTLTDK